MAEKIIVPVYHEAISRFSGSDYFRVVLFGASNTERYYPFSHWADVLEAGFWHKFGRKFHIINSGVSGNNTREALSRFDRDVADFKPDMVIVTLGGNDCIPALDRHVPEEEFVKNLLLIAQKVRDCGALVVFQTYYKMDAPAMEPVRAVNFVKYMDLVRQAARECNAFLVEQFQLFDQVDRDTLRYKLLMNAMHVNEYGNMLMGVNLLYNFGIEAADIMHAEKLQAAVHLFWKFADRTAWLNRVKD